MNDVRETNGASLRATKPYLPLVFSLACTLWLATALSYHLSSSLEGFTLIVVIALSFVLSLVLAVLLYFTKRIFLQYVLAILLGFSLGVLSGAVAGITMHNNIASLSKEKAKSYVFETLEDSRRGNYASSCFAKTQLESGQEIIVQVNFGKESKAFPFGSRFSAKTLLKVPSEASLEYLWSKGAVASTHISQFEELEREAVLGAISNFREEALKVFDDYNSPGAALLKAVLFGDRSSLEEEGFYNQIKAVGLAHMVAVSGAHLVIVASMIAIILKILRLPRALVVFIQILFIVGYLLLTAMPISAIRAAAMTIVAISSIFFKRRSAALNALALCILFIVVVSPSDALSISFMLSALSSMGIIVLGSLFRSWSYALIPHVPSFFHENISLTFSAGVVTIPLSAAYFSQTSLISPFMNVFSAPVFIFLCLGGFVAVFVGLCLPVAGSLVEAFVAFSDIFCTFIAEVSNLPFIAIPISLELAPALLGGILILLSLWITWPQASLKAGLSLCCVALCSLLNILIIAPHYTGDEIIMLDVGQGDAFLVRSQGATVLIDTGAHRNELLKGLGRHNVYELDAVIISHADSDHSGALRALEGLVQVKQLCLAKPLLNCNCDSCKNFLSQARSLVGEEAFNPLVPGDNIKLGNFTLSVLWPHNFSDEGGNADSLTLLLSTTNTENDSKDVHERESEGTSQKSDKDFKALFCGDLEQKQLASLIEEGKLVDIDLLKVGHHGSKEALNDEILSILQPEAALISVGQKNRYGHPAAETIAALNRGNCEIFRSDEAGDVVCKFESEKIKILRLG